MIFMENIEVVTWVLISPSLVMVRIWMLVPLTIITMFVRMVIPRCSTTLEAHEYKLDMILMDNMHIINQDVLLPSPVMLRH